VLAFIAVSLWSNQEGVANKDPSGESAIPNGRIYKGEKRHVRTDSSIGQRSTLAALMLVLAFTLGVGPEDSALVFLEETLLRLDPETEAEGADVTICNLGDVPLNNVSASAEGFSFPEGKHLKVMGGSIGDLPQGGCKKVTLQADQGLGEESYEGLLTVSADGVKSIARQVVIGPPDPAKVSAAAKPVRLIMGEPSNIARVGSPGAEFKLPLKLEDAATLQTEAGEKLGTLSGGFGDGHARVVATEATSRSAESGEVVSLPVRVEDLEGVGTYTGTLTVGGANFESELFVSDSLLLALYFLLIGVIVGWYLLIELKKRLPIRTLRQRCRNLAQTYDCANRQFALSAEEIGDALRAADANDEIGNTPQAAEANDDDDGIQEVVDNLKKYRVDPDRVSSYQRSFGSALNEYDRENTFVDTSTEGYKQIVAMLDDAEADARRLEDSEGLRRPLEDLALTLHHLARYLRDNFRADRRPALCLSAAAPLTGKALKVGATKELSDKAKGSTDLVATWRKIAERLRYYEIWGANLESNKTLSDEDRKTLVKVNGTVADGKNELLDAEDAAALTALSTNRELRQAYNSIAHLGKKYEVSPTPTPEQRAPRRVEGVGAQPQEEEQAGQEVPRPVGAGLAVSRWVRGADPVTLPERPETVTKLDPDVGHLPPWVLPTLGGIVALLGVLVAEIYPDGGVAFGTTKDYLAAFVQGPLAAFATRLRPGG
jgi:hypothetical protein